MSYYNSQKAKLSFASRLIVFLAVLICLWAAGLAAQYYFQEQLGEYSIYSLENVNEYVDTLYPVPVKTQKVYVDKDFKKKSNEIYVIHLITGGEIFAKNIMISENSVSFKDDSGMSVTIDKGQIESIKKKDL